MWRYVHTDELYHYGVIGMKWGKRKAIPKSNIRTLRSGTKHINDSRNAIKDRRQKYLSDDSSDKVFDKTYRSTYNSLIKSGVKKNKAEDKAMKVAISKAGAVEDAMVSKYRSDMKKLKYDYKTAKKEYKQDRKQDIKEAYKEIKKSSTLGEKILYSNKTRKRAAKYVVDHNMSMEKAKKAANQKAIRNTAVALAVIGTVVVKARR